MKNLITYSILSLALCISCGTKKFTESTLNDKNSKETLASSQNISNNTASQANQQNSILTTQDSIQNYETQQNEENPYSKSRIEYSIINSENNTYGYTISIDDNLTIHQTNIPGQPGNNGFSTKIKAEKTAIFVIYKIRNNIMPPTISKYELDSLGVLK